MRQSRTSPPIFCSQVQASDQTPGASGTGAAVRQVSTVPNTSSRSASRPGPQELPCGLPDWVSAAAVNSAPTKWSTSDRADMGSTGGADASVGDETTIECGRKSSGRRDPSTHASTLAPLLTTKDAAQILNVSQRTIRRLIASGSIPAVRIGRSVRIRRRDLVALIGSGETLK